MQGLSNAPIGVGDHGDEMPRDSPVMVVSATKPFDCSRKSVGKEKLKAAAC